MQRLPKNGKKCFEGLVLVEDQADEVSVVEINSETDFVAKNKFYKFLWEISKINFKVSGNMDKIQSFKMDNGKSVNDNLISLIAKIGEKITQEDQVF